MSLNAPPGISAVASTSDAAQTREPVLDTVDRVSEICFGLFMALTFVSLVHEPTSEPDVSPGMVMFSTALGCNLAWGVADAVMFLLRTFTNRGRRLTLVMAIKGSDAAHGVALLRESMAIKMKSLVADQELEAIRQRVAAIEAVPARPWLDWNDLAGALGIFALVTLGTFPVALPFALIDDVPTALLYSRILSFAMLFGLGYTLGKYSGFHPWRWGGAMMLIGMLLTWAIIALGG